MPSNLIFNFPTLASSRPSGSWKFPVKYTPSYSTIIKTSANGIENRISMYPYPIWLFEFYVSYLKGNASQAGAYRDLVGFYMNVGGSGNSFLYLNPWDNVVTPTGTPGSTAGFVAIGDGATRSFQLFRQIGIGNDIVQNPQSVTPYLNGSPVSSGWTLDYGGVITFSTAPAGGTVIAWAGTFYFRLRFGEDSLSELEMILSDIWDCATLKLQSVILPG